MSYSTIKWTIFIALLLTVPAMLFLVQVVMFVPAIFFVAGIVFMVPKAIIHSKSTETLWFIVIFGIHFLVYFGIYYLVSIIVAKLISIIHSSNVKKIMLATILALLVIITQLPVYGGGGHGPIEWVTLNELFTDLNKSHGRGAVITVYGCTVLLLGVYLFLRRKRKKVISET
ncbi:MAG: hypothetical protein ACR2NW_03210 [Thermodesulfobacteriota bacterium]